MSIFLSMPLWLLILLKGVLLWSCRQWCDSRKWWVVSWPCQAWLNTVFLYTQWYPESQNHRHHHKCQILHVNNTLHQRSKTKKKTMLPHLAWALGVDRVECKLLFPFYSWWNWLRELSKVTHWVNGGARTRTHIFWH